MFTANSAVLKMPKSLPDIIKSYKLVLVENMNYDMRNSSLQVKQGDYITIFARGDRRDRTGCVEIAFWGPPSPVYFYS
jgi:hypothetical protein